jgi:hypothetical protein
VAGAERDVRHDGSRRSADIRSRHRIAIVLVAALAAAGALLLALADSISNGVVRGAAEALAGEIGGVEGIAVRLGDTSLGVFPLRIEARDLHIVEGGTGEGEGATSLALVERAVVAISARSLLMGNLEVLSLEIAGAKLWLRVAGKAPGSALSGDAAVAGSQGVGAAGDAFRSIRRIGFRDTVLVLELPSSVDSPGLVLPGLDGRIDLEAEPWLRATTGEGALSLAPLDEGTQGQRVDLSDWPLEVFRPLMSNLEELEGRATGHIDFVGALSSPRVVRVALRLEKAALRVAEMRLQGGVMIRAELVRDGSGLSGSFDADARDAQLDYGSSYRKAPGTPASVSGRLVPKEDGLVQVESVRYRVEQAKLRVGGDRE